MPTKKSIFFDEWRACLHAHYEYVVREGDAVTEPTLRHVLRQTGLSDAELDTIRAEVSGVAVAHAEAASEAYIDDVPVLEEEIPPAEDALAAEVMEDEIEEPEGWVDEFAPPEDAEDSPPPPSQLSMF